ncbi:RagB/SusD family nutrient uptake outer membrane protein [Parapedobacter sp. DT-150]|uniref:RagB/SusD family nutrient uptake outer membrane protein n=1 Tax=Parapedobacter sp. DT-150 TaxID=3396162 RepID=UPI003F1C35AA
MPPFRRHDHSLLECNVIFDVKYGTMKCYRFIFFVVVLSSCGKNFLEVKTTSNIVTPHTAADFQAILDNGASLMNGSQSYLLSIVGSDEYYLSSSTWHALPLRAVIQKNAYVWADNVYEGNTLDDWNRAYMRILNANVALDGASNSQPEPSLADEWNNVKGSALFFRAYNFYQLAQLFCKPFDRNAASRDLGIPLRLEADVTLKTKRATLAETYDRIVTDLEEAVSLLPDRGLVKMRPSKAAAFGLLARVHLQLEDYQEAGRYADQALQIQNELIDYSTLPTDISYPFDQDYGESNIEVVFFSASPTVTVLHNSRMEVDTNLLALYNKRDLRRRIYYDTGSDGNIFYRGSYFGGTVPFTGITTGELLLIRAECSARLGATDQALADVNRLNEMRFEPGIFQPYNQLDADQVLALVLDERKRELAFRGLRWEDLRRLNKDPKWAETIRRKIDDTMYTLEPNSAKYVWPIPEDVIELGGLEQNTR